MQRFLNTECTKDTEICMICEICVHKKETDLSEIFYTLYFRFASNSFLLRFKAVLSPLQVRSLEGRKMGLATDLVGICIGFAWEE